MFLLINHISNGGIYYQTLKTLKLTLNYIEDEGAQHLASALQTNMVTNMDLVEHIKKENSEIKKTSNRKKKIIEKDKATFLNINLISCILQ